MIKNKVSTDCLGCLFIQEATATCGRSLECTDSKSYVSRKLNGAKLDIKVQDDKSCPRSISFDTYLKMNFELLLQLGLHPDLADIKQSVDDLLRFHNVRVSGEVNDI